MKKCEARFQTAMKHWHKENPPKLSGAYELKYERTNRFNFSAWIKKQPHQLQSLLAAERDFLYHKISDAAIGFKPFDYFILAKSEAFLIIYFERQQKAVQIKPQFVLKLLQSGEKSASFEELIAHKKNKIINIKI